MPVRLTSPPLPRRSIVWYNDRDACMYIIIPDRGCMYMARGPSFDPWRAPICVGLGERLLFALRALLSLARSARSFSACRHRNESVENTRSWWQWEPRLQGARGVADRACHQCCKRPGQDLFFLGLTRGAWGQGGRGGGGRSYCRRIATTTTARGLAHPASAPAPGNDSTPHTPSAHYQGLNFFLKL